MLAEGAKENAGCLDTRAALLASDSLSLHRKAIWDYRCKGKKGARREIINVALVAFSSTRVIQQLPFQPLGSVMIKECRIPQLTLREALMSEGKKSFLQMKL